MKVFLVYVRDEDFYHLLPQKKPITSKEDSMSVMAFPALGIETLAPVIREHGHEVVMYDTCHPFMKEEHIAQDAVDQDPDVIALSFLSTTSYEHLKSMARKLKERTPHIPIIVGGTFATYNSVNVLKDCSSIDFVGVGEGEELLPDFLDNIDNPSAVGNLVWRAGDEVIRNPGRLIIQDLDKFPYPDRQTLPINYIESLPLDVPAVLSMDKFCTIQTSRGCPYKCIYCDIPALAGGKWRCRSAEHVLGEMQLLHDQGYRSIYMTDDHFLLKHRRIQAICEGIIERKLEFSWGCEGRVDSVAINQFPIMGKANCGFLAFGVESGTQRILDRLKKDQTLDQIEHAVKEAKKYGIKNAHGFFLVGSPEETESDIIQSFKFAARLKLDTFGFNRLCVYRGTPLWQEYLTRGLIDDERDWDKWFRCSEIDPTVLPGDVVHRARKKGYLILFAYRIFFRPIETYKLVRKFSRYMRFIDVMKLILSPFRRIDHHESQKSITKDPEIPVKMAS
ncbi:MAG: radical SAM protein [Bacteroidetes bacterium]|nr:radical SAM protein [Bacteroidota bacterium]